MWYSIIILIFLIGFVNTQCPPKEQDMKTIIKFLQMKLEQMKKYKPGLDSKDVDWAIGKVGKDVVTNKKYLPCNNGLQWDQLYPEANNIRKECYKPADFSLEPVQREFKACVFKFFPPLVIKYGGQAIDACSCFTSVIVPGWEGKYKKYINTYIEEFKTLKHRKK